MNKDYRTSAETANLGSIESTTLIVPAAAQANDVGANEGPAGSARSTPVSQRTSPAERRTSGVSSPGTENTPFLSRQNTAVRPEERRVPERNRNRMSTLTRLLEMPAEHPAVGNDPWRFVVVLSYSLLAGCNAMQWVTFSPVPHEVGLFFHTTATEVNYLTSVYLIVYGVAVIVSCKAFEAVGLKKSLTLAATLNAIGAGVKIIAVYVYPQPLLLFVSQCINALAQVFIIAHPPTISNMWFGDSQRTMANASMTAAQNFGIAIGVVLPTLFINLRSKESNDERTMEILRMAFARFFWTQLSIAVLAFLTIIFLFPTRPKYAASVSAATAIQSDLRRIQRDHLRIHRKVIEKDLQRRRMQQEQQLKKSPELVPQKPEETHIALISPSLLSPRDNRACAYAGGQLYLSLPGEDPTEEIHSNSDEIRYTCASEEVEEKVRRSLVAAVALAAAESGRNSGTQHVSGALQDDMEDIIMALEDKLERISKVERENPRINIFHILRDSVRVVEENKSFACMIFSSSMQFGAFWSLATVIPQAVSPLGISEQMAGWIGFVNLVVGGLSAPVLAPIIVGPRRNFKVAWIGCSLANLLDMSVMLLFIVSMVPFLYAGGSVTEDNRRVLLVFFIGWGVIGGMLQNVLLPLLFEFGAELTFPVSGTTTATVTIWTANLSCFILTQMFSFVLGTHPGVKEMLIMWCIAIGFILLGGIGILSVYPHNFREAHEANLLRLRMAPQRGSRISLDNDEEPYRREIQ